MLKFAYTIGEFVADSDFAFTHMDTDSLGIELAGPDLDGLIIPHKREQWLAIRDTIFPKNDSFNRWPGLFKVEFEGTGIVALTAKTYIAENSENSSMKLSHKGASKTTNSFTMSDYLSALFDDEEVQATNRGFKRTMDGRVLQYSQNKVGLTPYYVKRTVMDDKINTKTLRFPFRNE